MSFGSRLRDYPDRVRELLADYRALKELYPPLASAISRGICDGLVSEAEGSLIMEALRIVEEEEI